MSRSRKHTAEQIIGKLREAEIAIFQGQTAAAAAAAKLIVVTAKYIFAGGKPRFRNSGGGLRTDQAKRLKEFEKQNSRLKRLLADAELGKAILKEAASGNF